MRMLLALLLVSTVGAQTLAPGTYTVPVGTTITVPGVAPPTCTVPAPPTSEVAQCTPPLVGSWTQTRVVSSAAYPTCWTVTSWTPSSAPAGSCAAVSKKYSVYSNGVLGGGDGNWVGDFDNSPTEANYRDTTGAPATGTYDLKFTGNQQWPIWMPYANDPPKSFPMAGYTSIQFDLKPTSSNQPFSFYFVPAGDEASPSSCTVNLPNAAYSGPFVAGQWVHVTIALGVLCVTNPAIFPGANVYKFGMQEQSGKNGAVWYENNVTFQ